MNLGNIVGFIAMGIAVVLIVRDEWGWAIGVFIAGAALGGLINMAAAAGMRRSLGDQEGDRN